MKRVVITGIGMITPLGETKNLSWEALINGESGIKNISYFDTTDFPCKVAGEARTFIAEKYIAKKEMKKMGRFTHFAVAAAKMAVEDSKLEINIQNDKDIGVIISSGIGGIEIMEESFTTLKEKGVKKVSPFTIPAMIENMATGVVAIELGAKGISKSIVTACATGSNSIGDAYETIKYEKAKVMIAGGTEACITPLAIAGFCAAKTLSTKYNETPQMASRPFDAERDGFVMGEGAAVLVLEELEHALGRSANIYAEIVGYGESNDAYHLTSPAPQGVGAVEAMNRALKFANILPESIDYINAHGTATKVNDATETAAFKGTFGKDINNISISSIKGAIGHTLGAAGAIEAAVTIMSIKSGIIPPTINYENFDEDCDLDYTANKSKTKDINYAMSTSFGFGGHNSVLIFKKFNNFN